MDDLEPPYDMTTDFDHATDLPPTTQERPPGGH